VKRLTDWYKEYLLSDEWKNFARMLKVERGGKCEICGSDETLHIHHLDYTGDLKDKDFLIVLCADCHTCMENTISRFLTQINNSYLLSLDTFNGLMKKSIIDFYQNSIFKEGSRSTVKLNPVEYVALRKEIENQLKIRFPQIEIRMDYRHIRCISTDYIPAVMLEESGVAQWRNRTIRDELANGTSPAALRTRFRLSEQAFRKAKGR
jgi:hypothetical protein